MNVLSYKGLGMEIEKKKKREKYETIACCWWWVGEKYEYIAIAIV